MDKPSLNIVREEPAPCRIKLNIEVPAALVKDALAQAEKEFKKHAKIPGFRPGKAPRTLLLRHYGDRIQDETKDRLLRDNARAAIAEQKLEPETAPSIDNEGTLTVVDGESFVFAITFDIAPPFELPEYKGIKVDKTAVDVPEDQVSQAIDDILQRRTAYEKVERPAASGDLVKASYHGKRADTDEELAEAAKYLLHAEETWIALREPEILPGMTAALEGAEAGQQKQVTVEFPEDFHQTELAGQTVDYAVDVLEIHAANVPELTDELAQQMGAESADDARQRIRRNLEQRGQMQQGEAVRDQVLTTLLSKVQFDLPPTVLARETYELLVRMYQDMARRGDAEETFKERQEELRSQAEEAARQRLTRHYLLTAVAAAEELEPAAAEIEQRLELYSTYQNTTPKALRRQLIESGRIVDLIDAIREDKALERLVELADIRDDGKAAEPDAD